MNPLLEAFRRVTSTGGFGIAFSSLGLLAGDPFIIASGTTVYLDQDTPSLGYTDISGTLQKDASFRTLTTTGININSGGVLELGTAAAPATWSIVLTGAYVPLTETTINGYVTPTNAGTSRGIMVQPGGRLDLHGTTPATFWTQLNASAVAAATALTLAAAPAWAVGDPIIVASTEFPFVAAFPTANRFRETELFTLGSATSGTSLTLPSGLSWDKWGVKQYPVDVLVGGSGMALAQNTFSAYKASANVPTELDQRARVVNLNRGGSISCPNDTDWSTKGHGVHIMWMASGTTLPLVHIEGVQIRRGGQRGAIGRYPFHAHMNSYTAGLSVVNADATANYVRKCVVWDSENRAYTCHGTNGMEWSDNTSFNVKGHAYFLEDGSERRNKFYRNMAFKTREPNSAASLSGSFSSISGDGTTATVNWTGHGLYSGETITCTGASISGFNKFRTPCAVVNANQFTYLSTGSGTPTGTTFAHGNDHIKSHDLGSSGFWITNMDNDFQDNYSSDSFSGDLNTSPLTGNGFWCALSNQAVGLSASVVVNPSTLDILTFKGCTGHSNYGRGLNFAGSVGDEAGTVGSGAFFANKYVPLSGVVSTDHRFWKNTTGGYFNSVGVTRYARWVTADNGEIDFVGSTNNGGTSDDHLLIGTSLNNAVPTPPTAVYPRAGFIPYHGTLNFRNISAVNFPYVTIVFSADPQDKGFGGGLNSGGTDGYDQPGIDLTNGQNTGHKYLNSHPGPVAVPIDLDGRTVDDASKPRHWSIAAVAQDLDGKFGTAGKFVLPITPASGVVDDRYLTGAANLADGPVSGTVVCKTTDTRYFGAGWNDAINMASDTTNNHVPMTITRQNVGTGVTVGTAQLIKDGDTTGNNFAGYRSFSMQAGGRYLVQFTDGTVSKSPPASFLYFEMVNANTSGDFVILGLPWANGSVPRICFGSHFSNESGTYASVADVTAKRAVIPSSSGANVAAVVADTTGNTYFRDTTNNTVWVRYTLPSGSTYQANPDPRGVGFPFYDIQQVTVKV